MKFTKSTSKAARAIRWSNVCIRKWEAVIAANIMSAIVPTAWHLICQHKHAISKEREFIKAINL